MLIQVERKIAAWMLRAAACALAVSMLAAAAASAETTPVGVWLHPNGRIQMEVFPCRDGLCAKLVWFKKPNDEDGRPRMDINNPDPNLRARPLLGLQVLHGLHPDGKGEWDDGQVYNPDDGDSYTVKMTIQKDGTLRVRAYVLASLFGKTIVWTRVR